MIQKGMDIAILGGTFNPIHNGHIHAARTVIDELSPDIVLFVVAGIPPHKRIENDEVLREHRYSMTCLGASCDERFIVSDMELDGGKVSYTIDTVEELWEKYEPKSLSLILGTDMFLSFEKWRKYDNILNICGLIVLPRFRGGTSEIEKKRDECFYKWRDKIRIIDADVIDISSTKIRDMVKRGESIDEYVPKKVAEYIEEMGLYAAE